MPIDGNFKVKGDPKYVSLAIPALTEWPCGKLKSFITLLLGASGFSQVMNGNWGFLKRVMGKSVRKSTVMKSLTGWNSYRQVVMAITTRQRVRDIFCTASHRSITTNPKPLKDKPDHKQTGCRDKQTSREHVPDPSQQD